MKIDFIGSSLVGGGAERVMVVLADTFVNKGHDVSIITFNPPEDFTYNEKVKRIKLHYGKFKNHTIRSIVSLIKYYSKKKNKPDVIISFIASTNFISIIVAKLFGIKIIACEHTNHLLSSSKVTRFTREKLYRFANVVTILTEYDRPYYEKHKAKVVVMPNPSSFDKLKFSNIQDRENIILAVGSLGRYEEKGFDRLLYVSSQLIKNTNWKIKIIGGGIGEYHLRKLAVKLKIESQTEILGFRTDVDKIMQQSKIFVLPSKFEGLPMVLIEAMSQGMACVSYDCISGPSDIINNDVNGLLVEDQNEEKLKKTIHSLMLNEDLQKKLSYNALKRVDDYSVDSIYNKWDVLLNKLVRK